MKATTFWGTTLAASVALTAVIYYVRVNAPDAPPVQIPLSAETWRLVPGSGVARECNAPPACFDRMKPQEHNDACPAFTRGHCDAQIEARKQAFIEDQEKRMREWREKQAAR